MGVNYNSISNSSSVRQARVRFASGSAGLPCRSAPIYL
jgi:hypothetical protein